MVMTREGRMGRARRVGLRAGAAAERERAIDALVERAAMQGGCTDRLFWTLHHDFEVAPLTTNAEQLREVGLELLPEADLDDRQLQQRLWEVIETLADLGIFLVRTDHLDDRTLYRLLEGQVLREPVRDLPPSPGVHEFIDLAARADPDVPAVTQRDRYLPCPEPVQSPEVDTE
jgi:hypothetical protein